MKSLRFLCLITATITLTACPEEQPKKAEFLGDAFRDNARENLYWLHDSLYGRAEVYNPNDPIYSSEYPDSACEARRLEFMAVADSIQHIADSIQPILANAYQIKQRAIMTDFNANPWYIRLAKKPSENPYERTGDSLFELYYYRLQGALQFSGDTLNRKLHKPL